MSHNQGILWLFLLAVSAGTANAGNQQPTAATTNGAASDITTAQPEVVHSDLWSHLRSGFRLGGKQRQRSILAAKEYSRAPVSLRKVGERAKPFLWNITDAVEQRGMPTEIALLPVVESGFRPFAYSHGRAAGLWQFLPATGRHYGLDQDWWYDGRRDVFAATDAALDYLQYLHQRFDNDWLLALAAYNCGEGTVSKAIRKNRRNGKPSDYWSLDLPRETRDYVPRLLGLARLIDQPADYGIRLPPIPDRPQVVSVELPGQVDLALVARLANLDIEQVYRLNPGFNRWATKPDGPHHILIPASHNIRFRARLAAIPVGDHISWQRHTVSSDDSLGRLAKQYGTTRAVLRKANKMDSDRLRRGTALLVPVASKQSSDYTLSQNNRRRPQHGGKRSKRSDYIVRSGDTLWDISRLHGISYRKLAKWNGMSPSDPLKPGRTLVIWQQTKKSASKAGKAGSAETRRLSYRVRKGDSLWRISRKFKVAIADLTSWNSLNSKRQLRPGQQLTVYVDERNI